MRRPLPKILALTGTAFALYLATVLYLDWRIPRATVTIQIHPSMVISNPYAQDETGPHQRMTR